MAIDEMRSTLQCLRSALATGDAAAIEAAQVAFTAVVVQAWQKYQAGNIRIESAAVTPRMMYLFATHDLPMQIHEVTCYAHIDKELEQFVLMMDHIVRPQED